MRNRSGGTGCGWGLAILAMLAAFAALTISGSVGLGALSDGAIGLPAESHDWAGVLVIVAIGALLLAKRGER